MIKISDKIWYVIKPEPIRIESKGCVLLFSGINILVGGATGNGVLCKSMTKSLW